MADETNAYSGLPAQVCNAARVCMSHDIFMLLKGDLETESKITGFNVPAMRGDVFEMLLVEMFNENISPEVIADRVRFVFGQWMRARG